MSYSSRRKDLEKIALERLIANANELVKSRMVPLLKRLS